MESPFEPLPVGNVWIHTVAPRVLDLTVAVCTENDQINEDTILLCLKKGKIVIKRICILISSGLLWLSPTRTSYRGDAMVAKIKQVMLYLKQVNLNTEPVGKRLTRPAG